MPEGRYVEVFYGTFWQLPEDADSELMEEYEEIDGARTVYDGERWTLYFGLPVMTLTDSDQSFDEMALLRMIDLKQARLHQHLVDDMQKMMDNIPDDIRGNFSAPRFYSVWGK